MVGIVFVTVIAWIPNHAASYFGSNSPIPGGVERLHIFKKVRYHPPSHSMITHRHARTQAAPP